MQARAGSLGFVFSRSFSKAVLAQTLLGRLAGKSWALCPLVNPQIIVTSQTESKASIVVMLIIIFFNWVFSILIVAK